MGLWGWGWRGGVLVVRELGGGVNGCGGGWTGLLGLVLQESCRVGLRCRGLVEAWLDLWMCGATGGCLRGWEFEVDVWSCLKRDSREGRTVGKVEGCSFCQTLSLVEAVCRDGWTQRKADVGFQEQIGYERLPSCVLPLCSRP